VTGAALILRSGPNGRARRPCLRRNGV
jgi:hypothetical protein